MQPRGVVDKHAGLWREPPAGSSTSRNLRKSRDGSSNLPGAMCSRGVARPIISAFRGTPFLRRKVFHPQRRGGRREPKTRVQMHDLPANGLQASMPENPDGSTFLLIQPKNLSSFCQCRNGQERNIFCLTCFFPVPKLFENARTNPWIFNSFSYKKI